MPTAETPDRPAHLDGPAAARDPVAVLITYTMVEPVVGGAFFSALRLAEELH